MKILFLGYWGANEGLSKATIYPHLNFLINESRVEEIVYVSMERIRQDSYDVPTDPKLLHIPFNTSSGVISKLYDFIFMPIWLMIIVKKYSPDLIMCRSSLAGSIGYLLSRMSGLPFTVESFEPHADYMKDLGIWSERSVSYRVQKWFENRQVQKADHLMPVSEKYKDVLTSQGVDKSKVTVLPCIVNTEQFKFSQEKRNSIREELGVSETTKVGIYVGKFGDLYLEDEAFRLFKNAYESYQDFFLIVLTPTTRVGIDEKLDLVGIPTEHVFCDLVLHSEVPNYLSAADFAFSFHNPIPSAIAYSPIKNGEYWANGLPIVSPEGIGDDSQYIEERNLGALFKLGEEINWNSLSPERPCQVCVEFVSQHRGLSVLEQVYHQVIF